MSTEYGPNQIVRDALVSYYFFGNPRSYPGSGSTVYDLANNYSGIINGSLAYNNPYFTFNDTQYINTSSTPVSLNIYDASYTCEALASFSNLSGDNMIFGNQAQASRAGWHLGARNTGFYFGHYGSDAGYGTATVNTLYHIIWTFEKGESTNGIAKIWINGSNISGAGGSIGSYIATNNIYIGSGYNTTSSRFAGDLYYVRIYNKVLSENEINNNYAFAESRFML